MEELVQIIMQLQKRVEALERQFVMRNVVLPNDGKLVLDKQAANPTAETARISYNTTSNKFVVCENGVWRTITTT